MLTSFLASVRCPTQRRIWLASILFMALALRLAAAWQWQSLADQEGIVFRFGDSDSYWVLAGRIANEQPYEYHSAESKVFRAPLYPIFLSLVAGLGPQRWAVLLARGLGCIAGVLCVVIIYHAAVQIGQQVTANKLRHASPETTSSFPYLSGLMAATLAALYPGAIGMSIFILSEAIFCPVMLASLLMLYRSWSKRESNDATRTVLARPDFLLLLSGVCTGLAILARPSWLLWPGFVACMSIWVTSRCTEANFHWQQRWRLVFSTLVYFNMGVVLAMLPWWIRNYQVTGQFVPTTLQVGASLYDSFHPGASGGSDEGMTFSGDFARKLAKEREIRQAGGFAATAEDRLPFEVALDQRLKSAAIDWVRSNPSAAVRLALVKFWRTWVPVPQATQVSSRAIRMAEAVGYVAIVIASAIGLWWGIPIRSAATLYAWPCLYFAVIHSVFVGSVRYRQPAILALCVVAGIGTAWIVVKWKQRSIQTENLP